MISFLSAIVDDKQANDRGIADPPDAVQNAVFVGDFCIGGTGAVVENLFNAAGRVGVEHEDLAEVGAGGLEQVETIAFRFGEGLLVAKYDLVGILMQTAEGDESAALLDFIGTGNAEALGVGEDAWILLLDENGLFPPCLEVAGGARIDTLATLGIK